jgi:hypothetical protein
MNVEDAIVQILTEAGEPLHWTVIQDRALHAGLIDPFEIGDVRGAVQRALHDLAREGRVVKIATGVYARGG